ncbi:MAG: phospholipid carrier-dependent glycosyltransferase [Vicinamibacterales bacterium]
MTATKAWHTRLTLAVVIVAAASLRFCNLTAGYPHRVGADEPVIVEHALQILRSGDFNPHFYDYPSLYIYLQAAVAAARFLSGAMSGEWQRLSAFTPHDVYPWTRALNAALGTFTVYLTYRAGLRWGVWTAITAAALLAFWGNHVRESHFALTDVPLTALVAAVLVASLRTTEDPRPRQFALAGMLAGLAAAVKYNGAISLVMPLISAALAAPVSAFWTRAAATVAGAAAAYLVAAPYTILDLPGFLDGFAFLSQSYRPRPLANGLGIYAGHMAGSIGWPAVALVATGLLWRLVRRVRGQSRAKPLLLAAFPLVYLYVIATKHLIYARYLLPILPNVAIALAALLTDLTTAISRASWRPRWTRIAVVACLWGIATLKLGTTSVTWVHRQGARTTQDVAYQALRAFVPPGTTVAVEHGVMWLPERDYRTLPVQSLAERTPEQYLAAGVRYVVGTSDAYGRVLDGGAGNASKQARYRALFDEPSVCLPPFKPHGRILGPEIRICRLDG